MNIYISGISGTGMGPLALMAKAAGFNVCGSDKMAGAILPELEKAGIEVKIGEQDGKFLKTKLDNLDWFCYTSALPADHPELMIAKTAEVKCTKRDDLTAFLVSELKLKMVAVAGTHGKTTTTSMIIWAGLKLGLPISYLAGTTLGFATSGVYHMSDKYFIYEADEYDRNFLKYNPWLAVLPYVSYDHPDIYQTQEDYDRAFDQFREQSEKIIELSKNGIKWENTREPEFRAEDFDLAGEVRRKDASLAANVIAEILYDYGKNVDRQELIGVLNDFPGVGRRFEKLADGIYTDYAHHPEEIKATIEIATEEAKKNGLKGVVVIYQPHQNSRQHKIRSEYVDAFDGASKVFWLPTYLVREDPSLPILTPEELSVGIENVEFLKLNVELKEKIVELKNAGYLVILMTAGPADEWLRKNIL